MYKSPYDISNIFGMLSSGIKETFITSKYYFVTYSTLYQIIEKYLKKQRYF